MRDHGRLAATQTQAPSGELEFIAKETPGERYARGEGRAVRATPGPSRTRTQMKMLHNVQNERFAFDIDSESAIVVTTL